MGFLLDFNQKGVVNRLVCMPYFLMTSIRIIDGLMVFLSRCKEL